MFILSFWSSFIAAAIPAPLFALAYVLIRRATEYHPPKEKP